MSTGWDLVEPIVKQEEFASKWLLTTTREEACGIWKLRLVSRLTGATMYRPMRCDSTACRRCGRREAQRQLELVAGFLDVQPKVWVALFQADEPSIRRLRQRRNAKAARLFWVQRETNANRLVVATSDLGGREPPSSGTWVPSRIALIAIRHRMVVPGRWTKRFAPQLRANVVEDLSEFWNPRCGPETYDLAWEMAAEEAATAFGVRPHDPRWELPRELPVDWWIETLKRTIPKARKLWEQGHESTFDV